MACCPHFEQNSPAKGARQFSQWVGGRSGSFDRRRRRKMPRRLGGSSAAAEMESARINCSASSVIEIPGQVKLILSQPKHDGHRRDLPWPGEIRRYELDLHRLAPESFLRDN